MQRKMRNRGGENAYQVAANAPMNKRVKAMSTGLVALVLDDPAATEPTITSEIIVSFPVDSRQRATDSCKQTSK